MLLIVSVYKLILVYVLLLIVCFLQFTVKMNFGKYILHCIMGLTNLKADLSNTFEIVDLNEVIIFNIFGI